MTPGLMKAFRLSHQGKKGERYARGNMDEVSIYTDGGCSPNPGKGAWAFVILRASGTSEASGYEPLTTNNRMEMMAAIAALESLGTDQHAVDLFTDSQLLQNGMTTGKAKRKRLSAKRPNPDLWHRLDEAAKWHRVRWIWVRGHSGNRWNNYVDRLVGKTMVDQSAPKGEG